MGVDDDGVDVAVPAIDQAPATFAREVGVIEPPPDIKLVIDRTADFVRRVGTAFEKEIMVRNAKSKKFGFLQPTSPYHAYYQQRIKYGEQIPTDILTEDAPVDTSGQTEVDRKKQQEEEEKKNKEELAKKEKVKKVKSLKERMKDYVKTCKTVKNMPTEDVSQPDKYTVHVPSMFSAADIEVIKLTSMFVARNGRSFLSGLTAREQRNPQFDFLKPTHPLFSFFQQLVDAYAQIIIPPKQLLAKIKENNADASLILEEALIRAKFKKMNMEKEMKQEETEENERVAMALIDWHQFVVVETITFDRGEEEFLPAPKKSIQEITYLLEAQEVTAEPGGEQADEDMDMDMDVDMEEEEEKEQNKDEDDEENENAEPAPEAEPEAVMVESYEPPDEKGYYSGSKDNSMKFQKCPICGELIAVEELSEHMRIELLDPKWKEQKQARLSKQAESSLADSAQIESNLSYLARKRSDVFIGRNEVENEKAAIIREKAAMARFEQHRKAYAQEQSEKAAQPKPAPTPAPAAPIARPPPQPQARPPMQPPPPMQQQMPLVRPSPGGPLLGGPPGPSMGGPPPQMGPPGPMAMGAPPPARPMLPMGPPMGPPSGPPSSHSQPLQGGHGPGGPGGPGAPPIMRPGMMPLYNMQPILPAGMQPLMARPQQPQLASEEPASKKAKTDSGPIAVGGSNLVPENVWLAQHPPSVSVRVVTPADIAEYNCSGQSLDIACSLSDTVEAFKQKISTLCNSFPPAKMKINFINGIFLNKDNVSLAFYNVGPGAQFQLGIRERGGRKK